MIQLKNPQQIKEMREAGRITGEALLVAREHIREGISTYELDTIIRNYIEKQGAKPSFLGYGGFPGSACISVNDEVIHGIPSKKKILCEGDIVKVDVGAFYKGFHGDAARSFSVGYISPEKKKLIEVTKECFFEGIKGICVGSALGDIGAQVEEHAVKNGYSVVKAMVGHGIGKKLHEDPAVPNYGKYNTGVVLMEGMTLAIEPMSTLGKKEVYLEDNDWTVSTVDGLVSAHYENTVIITKDGVEILTL